MTADNFMNIYGSHAVMAVSYGGMIETYYAMFSKQTINSAELQHALTAQINASYKGILASGGASTGFDESLEAKYNINNSSTMTTLYTRTVGGPALASWTFKQVADSYADWVSALNNNADSHKIIDAADQGLVPIWYYFPDEYADVATIIENRFNALATGQSNALAQKMLAPEDTSIAAGGPYSVTMTRRNCNDDNGFDYGTQEGNSTWRSRHNGWEMGSLILYNTAKNSDGTYSAATNLLPEVKFNLTQDPNSLPLNNDGDARGKLINNDTWNKGVRDAQPLNGKTIGYGGCYYRVSYSDGSSTEGTYTDFFKNQAKGVNIPIVNSSAVSNSKTISSITVIIVYEIWTHGKSVGYWNEYSNWHLSYTFNFK